MRSEGDSATSAWRSTLFDVMLYGLDESPRGRSTKELQHHTLTMDMMYPVTLDATRKLNYRFMCAEAFWILMGDDRVETIAPYNPNIAKFSDDGITFTGAYGPPISEQVSYVVNKLKEDVSTRQAGLTIWRPNPEPSLDIPCTVAAWFNLRRGALNCHVFMRSNDVWLGTPYDVFNASMLTWYLCGCLHQVGVTATPGTLFHTAVSRHVYADNWRPAAEVLRVNDGPSVAGAPPHEGLYSDPTLLLTTLSDLREGTKNNPNAWWLK